MKDNIWKMCVVGLMVASPVISSAVEIGEAVAAIDEKYVEIAPGSSITLNFGTDDEGNPIECSGVDPAVIVKLAQASSGIRVEFFCQTTLLYYYNGANWLLNFETGDTVYGPGQPAPFDELEVDWGYEAPPLPQSFDSVRITAYGTTPVYLDALQGVKGDGAIVSGIYSAHMGTVTPLTFDPAVMVHDLVTLVGSYNLQQGIENSLDAKLAAALSAYEDVHTNDYNAAINKLQAFINEVEAQRNNKIEDWQATALVTAANTIIDLLTP